jgi:hypothetical protein
MPLFDSQRGVDAPWLFEARDLAGVRSQRMPPRFVSHRRAFAVPPRHPGDRLDVPPPLLGLRAGALARAMTPPAATPPQ